MSTFKTLLENYTNPYEALPDKFDDYDNSPEANNWANAENLKRSIRYDRDMGFANTLSQAQKNSSSDNTESYDSSFLDALDYWCSALDIDKYNGAIDDRGYVNVDGVARSNNEIKTTANMLQKEALKHGAVGSSGYHKFLTSPEFGELFKKYYQSNYEFNVRKDDISDEQYKISHNKNHDMGNGFRAIKSERERKHIEKLLGASLATIPPYSHLLQDISLAVVKGKIKTYQSMKEFKTNNSFAALIPDGKLSGGTYDPDAGEGCEVRIAKLSSKPEVNYYIENEYKHSYGSYGEDTLVKIGDEYYLFGYSVGD